MSLVAILGTLLLIIVTGALVGLPLIAGDEQFDYENALAATGSPNRGRGSAKRRTASSKAGGAGAAAAGAPASGPATADVAQLRDLEYDYRMGKMSEDDYRAARAELAQDADPALEADVEAEIEAEVRATLEIEAEAAIEASMQAELGGGLTETPTSAAYCPECGARLLSAGQKFCHQCGKPTTSSRRK